MRRGGVCRPRAFVSAGKAFARFHAGQIFRVDVFKAFQHRLGAVPTVVEVEFEGMPPDEEKIYMHAEIEYVEQGRYYLVKYIRGTIKAWGVIKR